MTKSVVQAVRQFAGNNLRRFSASRFQGLPERSIFLGPFTSGCRQLAHCCVVRVILKEPEATEGSRRLHGDPSLRHVSHGFTQDDSLKMSP
jgi:hypothetical protein